MEANKIEIRPFIVSLASVIVIEVAHTALLPRGLLHSLINLGVIRLIEIVVIMSVVFIWGEGLTSIGLGRGTMIPGLKRGLIWSAGFGIVSSTAYFLLSVFGINTLSLIRVNLPSRTNEIVLFFFVGGIVGPLAEELFFRGVLYGFFRRWGVVVALVMSTLIFVLIHPITNGFPVSQAVGGVVFALAYETAGSLLTPITIHVLGNIAIFTISFLY